LGGGEFSAVTTDNIRFRPVDDNRDDEVSGSQ